VDERERFLDEFHARSPGITTRAMARSGSYALLATPALVPGARVLDLGCGDGFLVELLRGRGARAIGLDANAAECAAAARRGVPVVRARAELIPFADRSFAAVVSHLAFMLMDAPRVARELDRVLVPGGTFTALLGGGPTADGDDAFHRYIALPKAPTPALASPATRTEAGWRALFPAHEVGFERVQLDLGGTLDEVWTVLGASYQAASYADFARACADFDPRRVPCAMVVFVATATRRS